MDKPLEFKQTLEYLLKNAVLCDGKYQATIAWNDIQSHHYLLSAFEHMDEYLSWCITINADKRIVRCSIFANIKQEHTNGQATLIFTLNQDFIDYYQAHMPPCDSK